MLSLFGNSLGKAIAAILRRAEISGPIAASVSPRLAKFLIAQGFELRVTSCEDAAGSADAPFAAIVLADADDSEAAVRRWTAHVSDGALVLIAAKHPTTECSRRALCAGLSMPEQLEVGRRVITTGRVTRWDLPL